MKKNYELDPTHVDTEKFFTWVNLDQKVISGTGTVGEKPFSWVTQVTVPCDIKPLMGRELELARQMVINATHKIYMRYYSGVNAVQWRCSLGPASVVGQDNSTERFGIGHVLIPSYRNRTMTLTVYSEQSP